jgi:hypothetical protein
MVVIVLLVGCLAGAAGVAIGAAVSNYRFHHGYVHHDDRAPYGPYGPRDRRVPKKPAPGGDIKSPSPPAKPSPSAPA